MGNISSRSNVDACRNAPSVIPGERPCRWEHTHNIPNIPTEDGAELATFSRRHYGILHDARFPSSSP